MLDLLSNPFISGILSFIVGALIFYINGWFKQRELKKEIRQLKASIVSSMDAHHDSQAKIKSLEEQVNKQKVTIQILREKPEQRELREIRMYAEACAMMTKNAPGFAQAWQHCLEEIAKKEEEEASGFRIFTKPLRNLINMFKKSPALTETPGISTENTFKDTSRQIADKNEKC